MFEWNRTASETAPSADTLAKFVAAASAETPLYIEWQRETETNDRPVEAGKRKCRPSTIIRMVIVTDRENHTRAARRDRREGRKDFRYWVTATLKEYKAPKEGNTHYIDGYAVPQLADAK
jgi:hypothetical protein